MEPFSTIASWDGDSLRLHDSTQALFTVRDNVATILGIAPEKVRVISHYTGGGFGCKLSVWAPLVLAAMAARKLDRPVKVVLSRQQMFGPVGFRPATVQAITLGAKADGTLTAIGHHCVQEACRFADYMEAVSAASRSAYACANVETSHKWAQLDIGKPTWMRAPGHATGSFAMECAMDELADKLKMDPIELRIKNYADKDLESGLPWSSNSLRECYKQGAQRFGWAKRNAHPGSMREGNQLIGMGMATAIHSYWHNPASASVELLSNGTAIVQSASQDIGTGTYTIMTQIAAEKLSLPVEKVTFHLGDTKMPKAPMSGGSTTAASVGSAVAQASIDAIAKLKQIATSDKKSLFFNADLKDIAAIDGMLVSSSQPSKSESFADIISRTKGKRLTVQTTTEPAETEKNYSISSFGAQFAEVRVDADLGIIHVARLVGAYAAGRILNAKTARSQLLGGITFGIGMALTEQTIMDHSFGRIINADFAEYHIPVHADIGAIDPFFVEEREEQANILGVKGVGELGITGVAAAIANAIYNATGKRIRELPITIDKLL
jgi:xanthine dehydrogenase YagR molybdenum-binding subunit